MTYFFFFFFGTCSSVLLPFSLATNVPFIFAITSESFLEYEILCIIQNHKKCTVMATHACDGWLLPNYQKYMVYIYRQSTVLSNLFYPQGNPVGH